MPPKKEPCKYFQRGYCQYGARCKYLHVTQQQPKHNAQGFGIQTGTQYQNTNSLQQRPNPFGFGLQNISQPRGANDFGSKQNQFRPFENKWSRFSPVNAGSFPASRQPDNQPPAPNHECTDPKSCKRIMFEDFEHERPLWKLTCYGHWKNAPCDIIGDISYEELRAVAYDDAKRGLNLQSIVERERATLNSKLVEFENLLHNPQTVPLKPTLATQSPFPGTGLNVSPSNAQNGDPPSVSSFSQLGASLNSFRLRPASPPSPSNPFGQPNSFHASGQTSNAFGANLSFGTGGSLASQPPTQTLGSSFASGTANFSNSAPTVQQNPFLSTGISPQIPNSASGQFHMHLNGTNSISSTVAQSTVDVQLMDKRPSQTGGRDYSIWLKEKWHAGEIPEEAPPDEVIF